MESIDWNERHEYLLSPLFMTLSDILLVYYIVYVMQGAGVTSVLLISSIQYVINVVMTLPAIIVLNTLESTF